MTNKRRFSRCFRSCLVPEARRSTRSDLLNVGLLRANPNAGGEMIRLDFDELRLDLPADVDGIGAAGMKAAPLGRVYWGGHVAFQNDAAALDLDVRIWNRNGRN